MSVTWLLLMLRLSQYLSQHHGDIKSKRLAYPHSEIVSSDSSECMLSTADLIISIIL